jgi:hypothetical protein
MKSTSTIYVKTSNVDCQAVNADCQAISTGNYTECEQSQLNSHLILAHSEKNQNDSSQDITADVSGGELPAHPVKSTDKGSKRVKAVSGGNGGDRDANGQNASADDENESVNSGDRRQTNKFIENRTQLDENLTPLIESENPKSSVDVEKKHSVSKRCFQSDVFSECQAGLIDKSEIGNHCRSISQDKQIYSNDSVSVSVDAEWDYKPFFFGQLPSHHPRKKNHPPKKLHSKQAQILCIQLADKERGGKMYTHPQCTTDLSKYGVTSFKTPFALFDYYGLEWRDTPVDDNGKLKQSHKPTLKIKLFIFYAIKDVQALFKDSKDYAKVFGLFDEDEEKVKLSRIRRTRISNGHKESMLLPYQVRLENRETGRMDWNNVSVEIIDISAMQGGGSLLDYARNVGIEMPDKEVYSKEEKAVMGKMMKENPQKFISYAMGDVITRDGKPLLEEIYDRTNAFYNQIAIGMGLIPRECWGLSVGKIDAAMMTEFKARNPKLLKALTLVQDKLQIVDSGKIKNGKKAEKRPFSELFYLANKRAGIQGFANAGRADYNKDLATYGSMVDGGRATANRLSIKTYHKGVLVDIDISGCYGNGLIAQDFAVGNPTIVTEAMKLGEFIKEFEHRLVPGLWCARINWDDAPFGCDLLISKLRKGWQNWDNGQVLDTDDDGMIIHTEEDARLYDASMIMQTHTIYQAIFQHDLLQLLRKIPEGRAKEGGFSSRNEWNWLLENATITMFAGYLKEDEVTEATPEMFEQTIYTKGKNNGVVCKKWVRIPMADWIKPLIMMRKQHDKGTPMNTFLKLLINATYGVIASSFFSGEGYGISDMVVGNNITARARALAWMMEKGLGCLNIATDGGVYNPNKVIVWDKRSLDAANNVSYEQIWDDLKNQRYHTEPLLGEHTETIENIHELDKRAWEWVKKTFPHSDICKYDQFQFESKVVFEDITFHSKSDYLLRGVIKYDDKTGLIKAKGDDVMKMRGLRSDKRKEQNEIMDAAREFKGVVVPVESEQTLSIKDHRKGLNTGDTTHLLPGDTLIKYQNWYSVTPLANKWYDSNHFEIVQKIYDDLKQKADAQGICELAKCDVKWYIKNYKNNE